MIASPYLTAAEAMEYLKLRKKQTLYYHIKENNLPVCRIGSTLRFDRADLDAWLRNELHLVPSQRRKKSA